MNIVNMLFRKHQSAVIQRLNIKKIGAVRKQRGRRRRGNLIICFILSPRHLSFLIELGTICNTSPCVEG
jgi:hypothetical protein